MEGKLIRGMSSISICHFLLANVAMLWLNSCDPPPEAGAMCSSRLIYSTSFDGRAYAISNYMGGEFFIMSDDTDEVIRRVSVNEEDLFRAVKAYGAENGIYREYLADINDTVRLGSLRRKIPLFMNQIEGIKWIDENRIYLVVYYRWPWIAASYGEGTVIGIVPMLVEYDITSDSFSNIYLIPSWKDRYTLVSSVLSPDNTEIIMLLQSVEDPVNYVLRCVGVNDNSRYEYRYKLITRRNTRQPCMAIDEKYVLRIHIDDSTLLRLKVDEAKGALQAGRFMKHREGISGLNECVQSAKTFFYRMIDSAKVYLCEFSDQDHQRQLFSAPSKGFLWARVNGINHTAYLYYTGGDPWNVKRIRY